MKSTKSLLLSTVAAGAAVFALAVGVADTAVGQDTKRICVSWRHFQEERWRIDEAGIKSVLDPAGYTYVSADAQADPQKQLTDVENLLAGGLRRDHHPGAGLQGHPAGGRPRPRPRRSGHRL